MYNHKHAISFHYFFVFLGLFPRNGSGNKESACNAGYPVWLLGQEDPLEKGMATHSSILSWRIPWTQEPGSLQSMGSQRLRQDWATEQKQQKYWGGYPSPWTEGPGGLQSMGSQRLRHNWSDWHFTIKPKILDLGFQEKMYLCSMSFV